MPISLPMSFEDWSKLVRGHDLTYGYSDDGGVWRRGQASYDLIVAESVNFPREDVCRVWNAMVDSFLIPEARAPFYWHPDKHGSISHGPAPKEGELRS